MRRLTWLRTTLFMARWKVQTEAPRDPSDSSQWSDAGLSAEMKMHLRSRIAFSFERENGSLVSHFRVTDGDAQLTVRYDKILPDLFREGQAVVATGAMQDGVFVAEDVLAKHDETYMPKEVADKMGKAHQKHDVQAAPTGTAN